MPTKFVFDPTYYNTTSANFIVPIIMAYFSPRSVLDVGCGIGTWLKCFSEAGVTEITGLDGNYVDRDLLAQHMSIENFVPIDLCIPFDLKRKYDLAISLEVAEHLPEGSAKDFVASLVRHSDVIIFSAAIPNQGGQDHKNEQWQEYWVSLFGAVGFRCFDIIRPKIWNQTSIEYWYRQNMLVFSKRDLSHFDIFQNNIIFNAVHPELLKRMVDHIIYQMDYIRELETQIFSKENIVLK